ncbi:MAG TPA: hypothetical protein VIK89_16675, partial [Cytophagaceae bacterium]
MKKLLLLILSLGVFTLGGYAQDRWDKEENCDFAKKFSFEPAFAAGYTHWVSDLGVENEENSLVGNGLNLGPAAGLYYNVNRRLKIGADASYLFTYINKVEPDNGFTDDVFEQDNNRRDLLSLAGSVQYSLIASESFDLIAGIDGGTFWINNDAFSQNTRKRYYGSAEARFQFNFGRNYSFFIAPEYMIYRYKLENGVPDQTSYIHNFNG